MLCALVSSPDPVRGAALYHQRQFQAAEKELRAVVAESPANASARLYLARVLVELNRVPEALAEIERALLSNTDPEVRFQAGRILRQLAELRFAGLNLIAPGSAAVHELAGRHFELRGQLADALHENRSAAELEPGRPGIHYLIGNILWRTRELDAAATELATELALNPHHDLANLRLGQIWLARNEAEQALPFLERAARAMLENTEARRELGKAYQKAGRLPDARREWESVAKSRPDDDQVHYLLGNLYREIGEVSLARQELARHRQILERRRAEAEKR